jgi:hypothetical protein
MSALLLYINNYELLTERYAEAAERAAQARNTPTKRNFI